MNFDVLFSKNMLEKWFGQGDVGWIWHNFLCQCLLVVHLSISLVSGAWHVGAKQIYATGISFLMNCSDHRNLQHGLSSDKRLLKYTSLSYNLIFEIAIIAYYIHFYFVNDNQVQMVVKFINLSFISKDSLQISGVARFH